MTKCPKCDYDNADTEEHCVICGVKLNNIIQDSQNQPAEIKSKDNAVVQNKNNEKPNNIQQHKDENKNISYPEVQNEENQKKQPVEVKSKGYALIFGILFAGGGYCYLNQWKKGITYFILSWVLMFLSFLIIPFFISIFIWIYSIYDVNKKVDLYNMGQRDF